MPLKRTERQVGTYYSGKYLPQPRSSGFGFGLAAVKAVVELEQRLSHGVREGDTARVDECDFANTPALAPTSEKKSGGDLMGGHVTDHERSRNVASKSSRAKQQASCLCDLLQVEGRENPPTHQFEIQVDRLVREPVVPGRSSLRLTSDQEDEGRSRPFGIHHRGQVCHPRT